MDHVKAVSDRAAERYLLREMSAVEAEEFERHYFQCQECASDVEAGEGWIANARAALAEAKAEAKTEPLGKEDAPPEPRESFWDAVAAWWSSPAFIFAVAAALVLGAISVYQGVVVIPGLRQPRILPAFQLVAASRGEALQITVPAGAPSVALTMDIPPDAHFPGYVCELSVAARVVVRLPAPAPARGEAITLLLPTEKLQAAQNEVRIYGTDAGGRQLALVATFAFAFQFR
jgi:hypothetical protein